MAGKRAAVIDSDESDSSNPSITGTVEMQLEQLVKQQTATIEAMHDEVATMKRAMILMEHRLQAQNKYILDFMGDKVPEGMRSIVWTPVIKNLNETYAPQTKHIEPNKGGEGAAAATAKGGDTSTKSAAAPAAGGPPKKRRKRGGGAKATEKQSAVAAEPALPPVPAKPALLAVNYDTSVYKDDFGRSVFPMAEGRGYCVTYTVTGYFQFDASVTKEKTTMAMGLSNHASMADVIKDVSCHKNVILAFLMDLTLHEADSILVDYRPLFLESDCTVEDEGLVANKYLNKQPEPIRSLLAFVLYQWKFPDTVETGKVFCEAVQAVQQYLEMLRDYQVPAEAKNKQPNVHQDDDDVGSGDKENEDE